MNIFFPSSLQLLENIFAFLPLSDKLKSQLVCRRWQGILHTVALLNDIQIVFNDCSLTPTSPPVQVFRRSPTAYRNLLIGSQVLFPPLSMAQASEMSNFWFWFGRGIKRIIFQYSDRLTIEDVVGVLKHIPRLEELALLTHDDGNPVRNLARSNESSNILMAYKRWRKEIFAKKIYALQEDSISKIRRIKISVIC